MYPTHFPVQQGFLFQVSDNDVAYQYRIMAEMIFKREEESIFQCADRSLAPTAAWFDHGDRTDVLQLETTQIGLRISRRQGIFGLCSCTSQPDRHEERSQPEEQDA